VKLELLAAGTRPPEWVSTGFKVYQGRMPPECQLILTEYANAKRSRNGQIEAYQRVEGEAMMRQLKDGAFVIALDKSGRHLSTEMLSEKLADWLPIYPWVQFMIGGPDGLSKECLSRADLTLSLSKMTFPHFLVRIMLAEQLYRAWTIFKNHPYHK
jgi:23S rRNA (pseudouridine1915-N3)-methyltransferase